MASALRGALGRERVTVWLVGLLLVAAVLPVAYFSSAYTAPPAELEDARHTPGVSIAALDGPGDGYAITPADQAQPDRGFVFYPGGRVHPDAYLPVLAPLAAETNTAIFVPQPPLNLAVLDQDRADAVVDAHPGIDTWYVGGHSLGGAMACRYAHATPDRLTGLVLLAAYCDQDVSDTDLDVLVVTGGADSVLNRDAYDRNRQHLPADATEIHVDGMNHTQFASYRDQPGDSPGTLTYDEAHDRLRTALADFLAPR